MTSYYSAANAANRGRAEGAASAEQAKHLTFALGRRAERMAHEHGERLKKLFVEAARSIKSSPRRRRPTGSWMRRANILSTPGSARRSPSTRSRARQQRCRP